MSSIHSAVLQLLETSSIPETYKNVIRDLLPNMSHIQQNSILSTLFKEKTKKEIVNTKREELLRKYGHIFRLLDKDPDSVPVMEGVPFHEVDVKKLHKKSAKDKLLGLKKALGKKKA
jgi:hypothetical protein